jgi:phenylalanyl-tRNA synthetase beta subunit
LLNPVDHNESIVQTSLIPSLLNLANRNHRNFSSMACFEIGRCYHVLPESILDKEKASVNDPSEGVKERRMVSVLLSVPKNESLDVGNPQISKGLGFYSLRTLLSRLVSELSPAGANSGGLNHCDLLEIEPLEKTSERNLDPKSERTLAQDFKTLKTWMHPFRAGSLHYKGLTLGVLAEVRPRYFDSKAERLVLAEVDIEAILATNTAPVLFAPINKFPDSFFEISLVIDKRELFSSIRDTFLANIGDIPLKLLEPVSVYEGKPLSETEKSLSLRFVFGKDDGTISAEELESMRSKVLSVIDRSKYRLRT